MSSQHFSRPTRSSAHLDIRGVSFSYPDRRVLTDISFHVSAGERIGLIGENGCGKSTLLKVIAGKLTPSTGEIDMNWAPGLSPRIGILDQEPPFARTLSVEGALEQSLTPVRRALRDLTDLGEALADRPEDEGLLVEYGRALDAVERMNAWEVDARVGVVLDGLGLANISKQRATCTLSGGERARLSLACLLLGAPDALVLDEPTNHLDARATSFLTSVLVAWRGPVLMASHDRAFLDATATGLVDMDPAPLPHAAGDGLARDGRGIGAGVTRFGGTYTDYRVAQADARRRWEVQYEGEQSELRRLRALAGKQVVGHEDWKPRTETKAAQKFYADRNARAVSRRVNDAKGRLAKLEKEQVARPPRVLSFAGVPGRVGLGEGGGSGARGSAGGGRMATSGVDPIVVATDVAVTGRLSPVSISVGGGEKWLITGPNGCGKSTLVGVLAGDLTPSSGTVTNLGARVGVLRQELGSGFDVGVRTLTAADVYKEEVGLDVAGRVPLGALGLVAARDVNRPFRDLSVGTQRRVALAVVLADPPDLLILDEPTNHFSLSLVEELEAAIEAYDGAVIVVSHDRWLREKWTGRRLELG